MDLSDYARVLRKRWLIIVLFAIAGLAGGAIASLLTPPRYEASTLVFVSVQTSGASELAQGNTFVQQQVKSYAEAADTPLVLVPVIQDLGLDQTPAQLAEAVTATVPLDTVNIEITAASESAEQAAEIANTVTSSFRQVIVDINQPADGSPSPISVALLRPATVPEAPVSPSTTLDVLIGLLIGLVVGLAVAVLIELLDTRVRGERDVRAVTDAPILGGLTFDRTATRRPLIVHDEPGSPRAEAFRSLRTNLQFLDVDSGRQCFVVTSSVDREGKTTTTANLAIAMADSGARVLAIDADLRRPALAQCLGLEGAIGLSDVLIGRIGLDVAMQPWGRSQLTVLASGRIPPNPSELLGSLSMSQLLEAVQDRFDAVLLDSPPLLPVTDAALLSTRTSGALLVVAAGRTTRGELTKSLTTLENVGTRAAGVILTMLPTKGPDAYAYGPERYSSYGPAKGRVPSATDPRFSG